MSLSDEKEVDEPIKHGGGCSVENNGSCDDENFCSETEDISLGLELHRRRCHCICKARYGHEGSRSAVFGKLFVQSQSREECGQEHESYGAECRCGTVIAAKVGIQVGKRLPYDADKSADEKCKGHITHTF